MLPHSDPVGLVGAGDRPPAHRAPLLGVLDVAGLAEDVVIAGRQHHVGRPDAACDAELRIRERRSLARVSEQLLVHVMLIRASLV